MTPGGRVAVVGGGVMGLSLARALSRAGFDVALASASGLGAGGASEVPVALINPYRGRSGRAHPDDLVALDVTWRWADELLAEGRVHGAHRSGVVRVADGPKQARAFAAIDGLRPFGPDQAPPPFRAPHGGAVADAGGWLEPRRWSAALAASAAAAGAVLHAGRPVEAIERTDDGRWRVVGADGTGAVHDVVLLATGAAAWPPSWPASLATPSFERHAGDVAVTGLAAPTLPLAGGVYLGPVATPAGLVAAVGGHHRSPGPPAPDAAARLRSALGWAWPPLITPGDPSAGDAGVWWGVRAHAADNRPQILEVAPGAWWVGGLAGRGFLAAAAVAEAAVDLVSRRSSPARSRRTR